MNIKCAFKFTRVRCKKVVQMSVFFFVKTMPVNIIQCSDKHNSKNNYSFLYFVCFCQLIACAILLFELES